MKRQLHQHFEYNSLFSTSEFGFRTGNFTIQPVFILLDNILDSFENNLNIEVPIKQHF